MGRVTHQQATATRLRSAEFLHQQPPGPYTSLIVRRTGDVPDLDAHVLRLNESLAIRRAIKSSSELSSEPWKASQLDNPEYLRATLVGKLQTAFRKVQASREPSTDLSAVALLVQGKRGVEIHLHVTPITWPTASLDKPGCAEIFCQGPRTNAVAKDSQWLRDRAGIEADLTPGAEGLLCTPEGHLLEGLVTNLFIVRGDGVVQTASPEADHVLDGIMRRKVVQCCQELGLQVLMAAPNIADRHLWHEGFLTNCLRVIQPLSSMRMYGGGQQSGQWTHNFDAPITVSRRLHSAMMASMEKLSKFSLAD